MNECFEQGKPLGSERQCMGWGFQILPYLEETAVYNVSDITQLKQSVIPVYSCPSRRAPRTTFDPDSEDFFSSLDYAAAIPATQVSFTIPTRYNLALPTYQTFTVGTLTTLARVFDGGTTGTARNRAPPDRAIYDGVIVRSIWRYRSTDPSGKRIGEYAVNVPQPVKFSKITDGTSNTFMIAEKFVRSDVYEETGAFHYSDDRGWSDGWDADSMRLACFVPINDSDAAAFSPSEPLLERYFSDDFTAGGINNAIWNVLHFGSPHTGGINAVFADGSVHTLSFDINLVLFNNLASRNGEELIDKSGI